MNEKDLNLLKKELNFINEDEIKKEFNKYNGDLIDTIYYVSKIHNKKTSERFEYLSKKVDRIQDEDGNLFEEENIFTTFIEESHKLEVCFFPKEREQIVGDLIKKIPLLEKALDKMLEKDVDINIIEESAYISPEILEQIIKPWGCSSSCMEEVE